MTARHSDKAPRPRSGNPRNAPRAKTATAKKRFKWRLASAVILGVPLLITVGIFLIPDRPLPAAAVVIPPRDGTLGPEVASMIDRLVNQAEASPRSAPARARLGLAYAANGMWEQAGQCFANAAALAPDEMMYPYYHAISLQERNELVGALEELVRLAERQPSFAPMQHRLGVLYALAGNVDAAVAAYQRTINLAPNSAHGYAGMAEMLNKKRQYSAALRHAEKALELDPEFKPARYAMGLAHRGLGNREQAEQHLKEGLNARPKFMPDSFTRELASMRVNFAAQMSRARQLVAVGKHEEAVLLLEELWQTRPTDLKLMNNLAVAYMESGRLEKARNVLRRALQIEDNEFATHLNLAGCLLKMGRPQDALASADRAVQLAPQMGRPHFTRGVVLSHLRRLEEALAEIERSVQLESATPEACIRMGELCVQLGRYDRARLHYEAAIEMTPDFLPAQMSLCAVCIELGDLDRAAAALAAAQSIAPDHPKVRSMQEKLTQQKTR